MTIRIVACGILLSLLGSPAAAQDRRGRLPTDCMKPVGPIRGLRIKMDYRVTIAYTVKEPGAARRVVTEAVHAALNDRARADGNSFFYADGQETNFTVEMRVKNDGTDHFTVTTSLSGWGAGFIARTENTHEYVSLDALGAGSADFVYGFVHGGWHDVRPACKWAQTGLDRPVLSPEGLERLRARALAESKTVKIDRKVIEALGLGDKDTELLAKQLTLRLNEGTFTIAFVVQPKSDRIIHTVREGRTTRVFLSNSTRVNTAAGVIEGGRVRRLTTDEAGPWYQEPLRAWGNEAN